MDSNALWVNEQKILRTISSLEKNNMNGYLVTSKDELIKKVENIVAPKSKVSCGGSMTLFEVGMIEHLRSGRYEFLDRYRDGITQDEVNEVFRQAFYCDAYFVSSNAITEDGQIYNVDGNGNRVAAMLFGPSKVIIIVGANKIVSTIDDAIKRNREVSAPANARRLNKETPCKKIGYCIDCNSKERLCNEYTVIKRQMNKDRIHVIFMNENLGY